MPSPSIAGIDRPAKPRLRLSFVRRAALAAAALALLAVGTYAGATRLGAVLRLAGASADPSPLALAVGEARFEFPANMVRFPEQRTSRPQPELDLYLAWPSLGGFTESTAEIFHDPDAARLLFLKIETAERKEREADALPASSPIETGPNGLAQSRRPGVPGIASEEIVYRGPGDRVPAYEASCLDGADPVMAADCIRDVWIGDGLRLRYRFSHRLLPAWDEIDRAVLRFVSEHRRP